MNVKILAALALALSVSACQSKGGAAPDKPQISMQAQVAILQADQDIKLAVSKKADVLKANELLLAARDAAAKGDSAGAEKYAGAATDEAMAAIKKAEK